MSDFDAVLERLLTDPGFAAALAAAPGPALAGYDLTPDEVALLCSQAGGDCAPPSQVERRVTKSSAFGLFGPLLGGGAEQGFGAAPAGASGFGGGTAYHSVPGDDAGPPPGLGVVPAPAPAVVELGPAERAVSGFGAAPAGSAGFGAAPAEASPLARGVASVVTTAAQAGYEAVRAREDAGLGGPVGDGAAPEGYRNRVDADGDGRWDPATYRGRADGGVDILVDLDGDGRADFAGHDDDRDNRVDRAHYDRDHDGVFETVMYDDDGDGWLDRTVRRK
ncbi:hypothetical protein [Spirilliplanes yamanashiensis]|uniref:Uncharacterized protein n=1 Tax=Spirilliplanes yamanashiensis TaxID=42233 RepID=A0A8J3Y3P5_9ACTN|nr:hypothetical protein [Spirilliplanes yamanashiensis]MDP9820078.1 hypothetical protein [Spirilliplanes yamanashiensis]GIJ01101.1 hypothetical protein Sya03_04530 [Spirilliplanes yamanashiensis]